MNKILLFIALIIGTTTLKAQQNAVAKPGAAFKFVEETHDFGTIKRGPIANYSFEFTNTGDQPLIIMDVKPSCGCTNVDWPKAPVKPGEKGKISLGIKSIELHGVFHKEVYILSNAVNNPRGEKRYTVYVKGDAVGDAKE